MKKNRQTSKATKLLYLIFFKKKILLYGWLIATLRYKQKFLQKTLLGTVSSFLTNFKVQGTFLMRTVAGLNLPLIRYSESLCHYCLFRSCRRNVLTTCVFLFLWFCFFPSIWGERVVCIVYPVGSEYSKKVHRRKPSSTVLLGFFLDDCRAAGIILLLHVCSRTRTIAAVIPDFFTMLPVIWRKGEKLDDRCCYKNRIRKISGVISDFVQCSLWSEGKERAVPSLFQEQDREDILQVWFPTLFNFPCDLKKRRDPVHRCCKNRFGKIFAGAISDFVKCSLWSEGK
jgi:hypothetical protein